MKYVLIFICIFYVSCSGARQGTGQGADMSNDEQKIRAYFDDWLKASKEGDLALAKSLIADDAVFYVPGGHRMGKDVFAQAATASDPNNDFEIDSSIEEINIIGDNAWLCTQLALTITNKQSGDKTLMKGHGLSILQRSGDNWVVIREANTMVPVPAE